MPEFYTDIDTDEFFDQCDRRDKKDLMKLLVGEGYYPGGSQGATSQDNLQDINYKQALDKLYSKRIYLTLEEEQFIINLSNKY
jgi:hypothetical protein